MRYSDQIIWPWHCTTFIPSTLFLLFHCLFPLIHLFISQSQILFISPTLIPSPLVCLPLLPHPLSLSPILSLSYRKWFLSRSRGLEWYTVPNKEVTVWILQNTKNERKTDNNQKTTCIHLISYTHNHILTESISLTLKRHKMFLLLLFYTVRIIINRVHSQGTAVEQNSYSFIDGC